MIDHISMRKTGMADSEVSTIVDFNSLATNSKDGVVYYDNEKGKFINDAFYLRIETDKANKLKLECSLHKYFNHVRTGKQTNHDLFTFSNTRESINLLSQSTGIDLNQLKISSYEIGMNLSLKRDCRDYLDKMLSIGIGTSKKEFLANPKYKDKRERITVFHRDIKKIFKAYDKLFEMKDKRRQDLPQITENILRIETIRKRVEKLTVSDLLSTPHVLKIVDTFLKDWRTVQFLPSIEAPKGTHQRKINLCQEIILTSRDSVLDKYRREYEAGDMTVKQFRHLREFIQYEWITFKELIIVKNSAEEKEFRAKLFETMKIVKH
jgi:hypothetical protein